MPNTLGSTCAASHRGSTGRASSRTTRDITARLADNVRPRAGRRCSARDPGVQLARSEVSALREQVLDGRQPAPVVAGQIDLARQPLLRIAHRVHLPADRRNQKKDHAEHAAFPGLVKGRLIGLADDRAEKLSSPAHVTQGRHGVNLVVCLQNNRLVLG